MPALNPLLELDVSTRARADAFAPEWDLSTRSVRSTSDSLALTMDITRELAAALESSVRVIGIQIEIDKGDGVLVPLLQTEIDGTVTLKASREGYGSRLLTFTLQVPPAQSPFYTAWARGPHRVQMTGFLGLPGAMQPRPMFVGRVSQCSWGAYPSLLRVECQDLSALLSSEMLAYNLDPGSLRTRKSVFREIFAPYLALYEIEFGQLDFGADDGGLLYKGISEGGTVSLLQWAAAFLAPIARRMNFGDGACNVEPSYSSGPVVRTYRSNDIANLSVSLPGTSDTNAVVMSSTAFANVGPAGKRTEVEIKIARATFAPEAAVRQQDHVTGAIADLSGEIAAADQEISRTITVRVYDGGTLVSTAVSEWGWYSARACPNEQLVDGSVTFNHSFDVFFYADGSCRMEQQQQYQLLRHTTTFKEWNVVDASLTADNVTVTQFAANIVPLSLIQSDGSEEHFPVYLTADGVGWFAGCEFFEDERAPSGRFFWVVEGVGSGTLIDGHRGRSNNGYASFTRRTIYASDEQGQLSSATTFVMPPIHSFYYAVEEPVPPSVAFTFGPTSSKVYALGFGANEIEPRLVVTYSPIDETSHRETTSFVSPVPVVDLDMTRAGSMPSLGERIVAGAIPSIDHMTSWQTAQPASVTVIDAVREGLLGKEVDDHQQNDFCETIDELKVCALELLRDKAPAPEFDSLIDWTAAPGKAIALLLPDAVSSGEVLTAWDMEWTFNGITGENNQHVVTRWLPQELR